MEDPIDSLYAGAPSEFVAARDVLAKQLRRAGRREEASHVTKLRRPTVAAWAVNQVARHRPDVIDALVAAGEALATTQRRALSGVKDSGLRPAAQTRRACLDDAWAVAAQQLRDTGIDPDPHRQAVMDTFEAVAVPGDAAEVVRAGRLSAPLPAPAGFGEVMGLEVVADSTPSVDDEGTAAEAEAEAAAARQAVHRADELERRSGDARQAAVRARAEAQRLAARAQDVAERAQHAAEHASQLGADAVGLQQEAHDARERAEELTRRLAGK